METFPIVDKLRLSTEWVKNSGSAFAASAFNHFQYNLRSELEESARYLGTDETILTSPVTGEFRDFTYDPIGNRQSITVGANAGSYTANNLNQYSSENVAGGGTNSYTFDEDGNLTGISGNKNVTYTYDAENRVISVAPTTPALNDKKLDLVYDYQGRRVEKAVSNWTGVTWLPESTKRFVYDGWNVIEEQGTTSKYYVWGLDLSQSIQGAGGIGGLLTQVDVGAIKSYAYLYDGNGNVGQLIDNSDGSIDAHYEYDPYGNELVASGVAATANPYRFSTKYLDGEFGLYYYGYRYYDPATGRWLNRDPIEEEGGINLYSVPRNDFVNWIDSDGRKGYSAPWTTAEEYRERYNLNVEPNWDKGFGPLNHTLHQMLVQCVAKSKREKIMNEVYRDLKTFKHFDGGFNNFAKVRISNDIAWFDTLGFDGVMIDRLNPSQVPVKLTFNEERREISGTTLGNHMLVGERRWRTYPIESLDTLFMIETESYDRPRGLFNNLGMGLAGQDKQLSIWTFYLQNIKRSLEEKYEGIKAELIEPFHENLGDTRNPWRPEN